MGTHYSLAFEHTKLAGWATRAADALSAVIGEENPIFCYCGYSGVTHGQALARAWIALSREFGEAYVRKEKEVSHGRDIEWGFSCDAARYAKKQVLVFVDDFISSGATREYVLRCVRKDFKFLNLPDHWYEATAACSSDVDKVKRCEPMAPYEPVPVSKLKEACEPIKPRPRTEALPDVFDFSAPNEAYYVDQKLFDEIGPMLTATDVRERIKAKAFSDMYGGLRKGKKYASTSTDTKPQTAVERAEALMAFKAMVDALPELKRDRLEKYAKSQLDWIPKEMLLSGLTPDWLTGRYRK